MVISPIPTISISIYIYIKPIHSIPKKIEKKAIYLNNTNTPSNYIYLYQTNTPSKSRYPMDLYYDLLLQSVPSGDNKQKASPKKIAKSQCATRMLPSGKHTKNYGKSPSSRFPTFRHLWLGVAINLSISCLATISIQKSIATNDISNYIQ